MGMGYRLSAVDRCTSVSNFLNFLNFRGTSKPTSDLRSPTSDSSGRLPVYFPTHRLTDSRLVYWHTHSLLRPSDHIQAAALAFASGSKMSLLPNGVDFQVERMNWKSP
jgi:hypothetical protein